MIAKRAFLIVLSLAFALSVAGCGKKAPDLFRVAGELHKSFQRYSLSSFNTHVFSDSTKHSFFCLSETIPR